MFEKKNTEAFVRRSAEAVRASRKWRRIVPALISLSLVALVIFYIVSLLFMRYGSFTVTVKNLNDRGYSLSLCELENFNNPKTLLNATEVQNVTNITYSNLPDNLNDLDGSHNGENYLAYTFYLKNTGSLPCSYKYSLVITRATLGIDAAARVRVYYNERYYTAETDTYDHSGNYTNYAKAKNGGNGLPEEDVDGIIPTNFLTDTTIVEKQIDNFLVDDRAKITVVIWLEGNDPECNDDILGGQLKVDMIFEIIAST